MVSAKKLGDKYEREAAAILEDKGYVVELAHRTMRRIFSKGKIFYVSQRNDFWNLFDLMAISASKPTTWVQVKSDISDVYKAKKNIQKWVEDYKMYDNESEVWQRVKLKGFIIHNYCYKTKIWNKFYLNLKGDSVKPFK